MRDCPVYECNMHEDYRSFLRDRLRYRQHASLKGDPRSYLHPHFREDGRAATYSIRIVNLAEMLYNLQYSEGIELCINQLATGHIESGLAEMQIGMMLHQAEMSFRYIDRTSAPGRVYDLEILRRDESVCCAEVKCKEEATDLSVETVRNSLKDAREQLPAGRDGIIFVRTPQAWVSATETTVILPPEIAAATNDFLRSTGRVAFVIFYVFHLTEFHDHVLNRHALTEFKESTLGGPTRLGRQFLSARSKLQMD